MAILEISVRVTRSNIPLRGSPLSVSDIGADLRYDAKGDEWVERSAYDAAVAELLDKLKDGRRLLGRVRRRQRKLRSRRPVRAESAWLRSRQSRTRKGSRVTTPITPRHQ